MLKCYRSDFRGGLLQRILICAKLGTVVAKVARHENIRIYDLLIHLILGRIYNTTNLMLSYFGFMEKCPDVKLNKALYVVIKGHCEDSACEFATFATTVP